MLTTHNPAPSRRRFFLFFSGICLLAVLQSCSYPSATAGGGETNQAVRNIGVAQFNHLYGWQAGEPQRVDDVSEVNFTFWTAFWKLEAQQRQDVFNSLPWNTVIAFCRFAENNRTMNEAGNVLSIELQHIRYRELIVLLDERFDLDIGPIVDLPGMKYLLRIKNGGEDFNCLEILEFFQPHGLDQERRLTRKQAGRLHLIFEAQVQNITVSEVSLSPQEEQLIQQIWP